jgi:hypothetical protein
VAARYCCVRADFFEGCETALRGVPQVVGRFVCFSECALWSRLVDWKRSEPRPARVATHPDHRKLEQTVEVVRSHEGGT